MTLARLQEGDTSSRDCVHCNIFQKGICLQAFQVRNFSRPRSACRQLSGRLWVTDAYRRVLACRTLTSALSRRKQQAATRRSV